MSLKVQRNDEIMNYFGFSCNQCGNLIEYKRMLHREYDIDDRIQKIREKQKHYYDYYINEI